MLMLVLQTIPVSSTCLINKSGGDKGLSPDNEINTGKSAENELSLQLVKELQSGKNSDRPKMQPGLQKQT